MLHPALLDRADTAFLLIDVQESYRTVLHGWERVVEAALAELEQIVLRLEQGDLPLEALLELYERGVQLSRFCHGRLEAAERRIEILNERGEARPAPPGLGLDPDDGD